MAIKYLWDTNIAISFLQKSFPANAEQFVDNTFLVQQPAISVISELELLCWKTATEKDFQLLQQFLKDSLIIELEPSIKLMAVEIRKAHRIKLPDAIIAATALVNDITLLSRNSADFKIIVGLRILNPWEK